MLEHTQSTKYSGALTVGDTHASHQEREKYETEYLLQELTTTQPTSAITASLPPFIWLHLRVYDRAWIRTRLQTPSDTWHHWMQLRVGCAVCFSRPIWFLLLTGQIFEGCRPGWTGFQAVSLWGVRARWIIREFAAVSRCRVEMKQAAPVFKMISNAIKVEEHSSGFGCFFHHSRSLPAAAVTYVCPAVSHHVSLCAINPYSFMNTNACTH